MRPNGSAFLLRVPSAAWVILLMMTVFTAINGRYLTLDNLVNIVLQNAVLLILSLGATLVILSEGIDLSLGSVLTLSGVTCVLAMKSLMASGASNGLAMVAGVLVGLLTGTLMGVDHRRPGGDRQHALVHRQSGDDGCGRRPGPRAGRQHRHLHQQPHLLFLRRAAG